ncbi:MAG: DivIVA domain-containing protein [Gaiellales bacterium]
MSRSPEEIRNATFEVVVRGFDRAAVGRALTEAAEACEAAQLERDRLGARVGELETELSRFHEMERLLRDTLVVAQRSGEEIRSQAKQDADALVSDARVQAAGIVEEAESALGEQHRQLELLRKDESDLRALVSDILSSALARWDEARWPGAGAHQVQEQRESGLPPLAVDAGSSLLGSARARREELGLGGDAGELQGAGGSRAGD